MIPFPTEFCGSSKKASGLEFLRPQGHCEAVGCTTKTSRSGVQAAAIFWVASVKGESTVALNAAAEVEHYYTIRIPYNCFRSD